MNRQKRSLIFLLAALVALVALIGSPVAAQDIPVSLTIGQSIQHYVDATDLSQKYHFSALSDKSIFLIAISQDYANAPTVIVSDEQTSENIAAVKMAVSGMCLRIAPGSENYTVNFSADHPVGPQWYGVLLASGDPNLMACSSDHLAALADFSAAINTASQNSASNSANANSASNSTNANSTASNSGNTVSLNVTGIDTKGSSCNASSGADVDVNLRAQPDQGAPVIGRVSVNGVSPVLGTTPDNAYLLLNTGGTMGFASASSLAISGQCGSVPLVSVKGQDVSVDGQPVNLGLYVKPDTNIGGVDAGVDTSNLNLDIATGDDAGTNGGLNVGVNANTDNNGLNANVNTNTDNNGLDVNADVNTGNNGTDANVDVNANTGNNGGANVSVDTPPADANASTGSGGVNLNVTVPTLVPHNP